jgi:hypothetical protein
LTASQVKVRTTVEAIGLAGHHFFPSARQLVRRSGD